MPSLKKIELPLGREDGRISSGTAYLIKYNNKWYCGIASAQWYGWNFIAGWVGVQSNDPDISELYEIVD